MRAVVTTLVLVVAVSAAQPAPSRLAPPAVPAAAALSDAKLREATDLLNQLVKDRKIAGAVAAVSRNGQLGYLNAVGVQDLVTRTPMDGRTLFRIYSMTKPVTAVAAMMLYEDGLFRLDDPVAKYLPEFDQVAVLAAANEPPRRPARRMTIEDLLLHTSGLNHRTSDVYRRADVRSRAIPLSQFVSNNYPANIGEYGWDGTAGTIFWIDPTTKMIAILMTQSSPANPDSLRQRFKTIVQQSLL
jgi:CubicO group peptidase (beta-lactamase class C family)